MAFNAKKFIKFINQQDWEKVESFLHKNASYTDPFCPVPAVGADKVIQVIREKSTFFPDQEYELERILTEGDHVVLELVRKGSRIVWNQQEFNTQYILPMVILIDLKDDAITNFRGFFDVGQVLRLIDEAAKNAMN